MANLLVEKESLKDIADAIRAKNGSSTTYKPSEMAGAISAIPSGGITPTGTININQNGTHNVADYEEAVVNVPNSYSASDEGKVVSNGALVAQTSRQVTANGTYDTTLNSSVEVNVPSSGITPSGSQEFTQNGTYDVSSLAEAVVNVASGGGSGGGLWTPVQSLIVHEGNAFNFERILDPTKHQIGFYLSEYAKTYVTGLYNSSVDTSDYSKAFFAVGGRNGNYNRWVYNGYGNDNVLTNGSVYVIGNYAGQYVNTALKFVKVLKGDGTEGTAGTAYPQTDTLLRVGEGWSGKKIYRFSIYDADQADYILMWIPALDSNGVPCFYDSVNKKLVYNEGTGTVGYTMNGVSYGI